MNDGFFRARLDPITGWFHLVVVYLGPNNGQGLVVYINGTQERRKTTKHDDSRQPSNGQLVIGKKTTNGDYFYSSVAVDELTLWNRQLTAQEVEDLHQIFP